ncbi:TPA: hypothetical protein N0F65_003821 [Lagenidium giganteum]|uniref:WDR59/RTC1-like RING zinc finger domain-containing protein n=1 Tax=Lagenidium giganteum TaxID=4803 RepID=A0AAV2YQG2_9STRA|nr:TPA: hypothetical protein N0F65_003821 [Lagenidium giganteum]
MTAGPSVMYDGVTSPPAATGSAVAHNNASTIHSNISAKYDVNAGALSVDATGSFGVLAGRKGLHLIDLEAPYMPACTLHHQTKWDVTVVKCNPHVLFKGHVASTSNHNTLIWNIGNATGGGASSKASIAGSTQPLIATLRAHTRPVSDVSWSPSEPTILATCSADTKTHLWDIRTPQRPVQTLCAFTTSAIQVEWNRVDQTSIATAHDGEVRIWDTRASDKMPAVQITAHMQKIYGIDWHPRRMDELVTCSEDKTVKFWNVTQPRMCQGTLTTGAPVWRARYTPFGDGLVTISHRLDNTLRLWAISHSDTSGIAVDQVHAFAGHVDLVKGFVWRSRPNTGVYQLISWSKNQELRMWRADSQHLEACGYDSTMYNETSPVEPTESLRPEMSHQQRATKYDLSCLKNDFIPLVVPSSAIPLAPSEYAFEGLPHMADTSLTFEDEVLKIDDSRVENQPGVIDDDQSSDRQVSNDPLSTQERARSMSNNVARCLPCPRISGASFSGPNMLLVFDSRVAIGQTRSSVGAAVSGAGKGSKPGNQASNSLPRTYEELLDLRDSRFATKKNKKPPVKLLATTSVNSSMELASDWGQHDGLHESSYAMVDESENSSHGFKTSSMFFSSMAEPSNAGGESEHSVHGGSEYLKVYFSSAEYHLPVNHPEHRISVPGNPTPGAPLSPRSSTIRTNPNERSKRVEQTPSLNLDLSLSVTLLDLSKLCGISPVLTYETQLNTVRDETLSKASATAALSRVWPTSCGEVRAGSRSLLTWMLPAADEVGRSQCRTGKGSHLSKILQSLLASEPTEVNTLKENDKISNTCANNSHVASLAGRTDLQQVWSLLEVSSSSAMALPMYGQPGDSVQLPTTHPWSAHPLGKSLVKKVFSMYEQVGDVPALASMACVLSTKAAPATNDVNSTEGRKGSESSVSVGTPPLGTGIADRQSAPVPRARASFGSLAGFTESVGLENSDIPPTIKPTRRSSSHNEVARSEALSVDKESPTTTGSLNRVSAKDWPVPRGSRLNSPAATTPTTGKIYTPKAASSTWKMDFEKLENPFKTWSSGSARDPSPSRRLSQETFTPPNSGGVSVVEAATPAVQAVDTVDVRGVMTLATQQASVSDKSLLSADPVDQEQYDAYKEAYAELLYRYGAMNLRSDVLKYVSKAETAHKGISLGLLCRSCQQQSPGMYCGSCRDFAVKCSVCQLAVRGQSMFCMTCGHGGHVTHLREWFKHENACPTGCGCWCKQATGTTQPFVMEAPPEHEEVRGQKEVGTAMKGSGLSLERFIQGKAHRTKDEAKSKKKKIIVKAQRRREYEKVKRRERPANGAKGEVNDDDDAPKSFYDRFFSELKGEDTGNKDRQHKHSEVRPDPFFKAKKKAEVVRTEREQKKAEKNKRIAEQEKKLTERKKRHVKLSVRTATGQPLVRNHIKDILAKLQAEK